MTDVRLSDEQMAQLAEAARSGAHPCIFGDTEVNTMHMFCRSLENGGWAKWNAILDFGGSLVQARKVGLAVIVATLAGGMLTAVWKGLILAIHRGHGG